MDITDFKIDQHSKEPLHLQVAEQVRNLIAMEKLKPGDHLPPVRRLAEFLNINQNTILRAYLLLEQEQIVVARKLGGTVIAARADDPKILVERQRRLTDMVGLLNAPKGTKLYQRLKKENRLLKDFSGDNTDFSLNFVPRMKYETLVTGYKHVLDTIYSPRHYYERVVTFLKEYRPRKTAGISKLRLSHIIGFFKTLWFLGVIYKGRRYYWKLLISTLLKRPRHFPISMGLSVSGFHFRKVAESYNKIILTLRRQST